MRRLIFTVPAALMLAGVAWGETDATPMDATPDGETFGTAWSLSVRTTFLSEDDTLRSAEDIASGWQSLAPEEQATIRSDCKAFIAAHGDEAEGDAAAAPAATGDTVAEGYDLDEMRAICAAVEKL